MQTAFPVMEDLLKDISDGQSLLGIIMFYHPSVISLEGKDYLLVWGTNKFFVLLMQSFPPNERKDCVVSQKSICKGGCEKFGFVIYNKFCF